MRFVLQPLLQVCLFPWRSPMGLYVVVSETQPARPAELACCSRRSGSQGSLLPDRDKCQQSNAGEGLPIQ